MALSFRPQSDLAEARWRVVPTACRIALDNPFGHRLAHARPPWGTITLQGRHTGG